MNMAVEQTVRVGILRSNEINVVFHSTFLLDGKPFIGEHRFTLNDVRHAGGRMLFALASHIDEEPDMHEASFMLKDVVIGIGFHWQRKENQTFAGELELIEEDGMVRAVNCVQVETYLTSVISSEMSADASLNLLRAHAVISRSWLVAMMRKSRAHEKTFAKHEQLGKDSIIRWYDSEAHRLFDVCADDHCQRYQGLTRQTNGNVAHAIDDTRGLVLTYDGAICDARFSKCCGGMTEVFESCWENVRHPYLVTKPDPYCNTDDVRILGHVLNSYDKETNDFYRWTVRLPRERATELICRKSGIDFGEIRELVPVERSEAGHVVLLKIVGEKRTVTVGKELEIRKWLSESHLYSSAFEVENIEDGFVLHGKGWGHGVGLCQIGAAVMGDKGVPYEDILQFYYPGTELTKMW